MSLRYRLQCDQCGRAHGVEPRQSGGTIECPCGASLKIPTLLKMKRLPPFDDDQSDQVSSGSQVANSTSSESAATPSASASVVDPPAAAATSSAATDASAERRSAKSSSRLALLIVSSIFLVVGVFFASRFASKPEPKDVFYKRTVYELDDGRKVRRDTTPISMQDYSFYYATDFADPARPTYIINDEFIDLMPWFESYCYFELVKDVKLSDNFYDNYNAIVIQRRIWFTFSAIVSLAALIVAVYAIFAKESKKQVGAQRGSEWR